MNIILISNKMAKAKSLNAWQAGSLIAALVLLPVLMMLLFITPKQTIKEQGVKAMLPPHLKGSIISSQSHLDAYAKQIGELQARIMRLDAQNQRLAKLAGDKTQPAPNIEQSPSYIMPNRGGPLLHDKPMSETELKAAIVELMQTVDARDDYQSGIEAKILQQSVLKDMLPNSSPVQAGFNSSSYGWRIDPFNGHKAFHEGLDFPANTGAPILAAADGIVIAAEHTPDYGKIVKINHGSGLETRYAHASNILVKVGERVTKGQRVALVGNTGRSTGPHLHYEIRLNGNALDPRQYLHRNAG
ncbi:MAG: peptidase M23 [Methylophilaceae bacterium 17-44-8]|jgi:murein DD-endopeptidase MepM/ murein hydrolase activator NlpD|nr:MAG: peptidase M23 [Methylophilales bacterium 28-44-11]OZA06837.1 MAG: peptidase M23 [Methylophilaceae bacterium 17-44-8]